LNQVEGEDSGLRATNPICLCLIERVVRSRRLFPPRTTADPQIVADEIVRIVNLPPGTRPRRSVADGSDWGAEIINGASEELRLRLARRMNIAGLLGSIQR
jgi:hypothetical protein